MWVWLIAVCCVAWTVIGQISPEERACKLKCLSDLTSPQECKLTDSGWLCLCSDGFAWDTNKTRCVSSLVPNAGPPIQVPLVEPLKFEEVCNACLFWPWRYTITYAGQITQSTQPSMSVTHLFGFQGTIFIDEGDWLTVRPQPALTVASSYKLVTWAEKRFAFSTANYTKSSQYSTWWAFTWLIL